MFQSGPAKEGKSGLWGIKDTGGRWLTPLKYKFLLPFTNGFATYSLLTPEGERQGYLNSQGKEATPARYTSATPFTTVTIDEAD